VEQYGTVRHVTNGNIIQQFQFGCWLDKTVDTHSNFVLIIAFHDINGYAMLPQCYGYTEILCSVLR